MSDLDPLDDSPPRPLIQRGRGRTRRSVPDVPVRPGPARRAVGRTAPNVPPPAGKVGFDNSQARQAWRQFARARGAARRDAEGQPRRMGPWLFLAIGIGFAALVYQWRVGHNADLLAAASTNVGEATGDGLPANVAAGLAGARDVPRRGAPGAQPLDQPTPAEVPPGALGPTSELTRVSGEPDGSVVPTPLGLPGTSPVVAPSPYVPRVREPPAGTPVEIAAALNKVPRARSDRAPIGGVGTHGIHVDRIVVGPRREDGSCGDARRTLSQVRDGAVQVCFRVVHQRQAQRLLIHWLHAGELVRRTFLSVPAHRAYRTRAWMPLGGRGNPRGTWTAVVKTDDGIEMAREHFEVVP